MPYFHFCWPLPCVRPGLAVYIPKVLCRTVMLGDRVTCPVCGRRIGSAYLRRHRGAPHVSLTETEGRGPMLAWRSMSLKRRRNCRASGAPTAATTTGLSPGRSSRGPRGGVWGSNGPHAFRCLSWKGRVPAAQSVKGWEFRQSFFIIKPSRICPRAGHEAGPQAVKFKYYCIKIDTYVSKRKQSPSLVLLWP